MEFTAKDIAHLIQGIVEGNEAHKVSKFDKIEEADEMSLCFFANEKYAPYLSKTKAAVIIVSHEFSHTIPTSTTLIRCENPYQATAELLKYYEAKITETGVEKLAFVSEKAKLDSQVFVAGFAYISDGASIGAETKIFPHTYIGKNVKIGKNCIIYSGVKIYDECVIGDNCILHSGVVIGSDGFGFAPKSDGSYDKIPQIGNVILEDHVEIGANTVIDRATMGSTKVLTGAKLDNLIQVAHNVVIGRHTVIAAQTAISGSTKIGDQVMIGGQVGIVGHINIGDKSKINAKSGVSKNLAEGSTVTGVPAMEYIKMQKIQVLIRKLPELFERVMKLETK